MAYTFQLYFDFSGYSDMAIGLGRLFGIRLPINFDSPYKAANIADFWQRWHITLTRWLARYLFIPLSRAGMGRLDERFEAWVIVFARIVTMTLCGIWHGAGWTFVVWGVLHGLFLVSHQAWRVCRAWAGMPFRGGSPIGRGFATALTFLCFAISLVLFRAPSLESAGVLFRGLLGMNGVIVRSGLGALPGVSSIVASSGFDVGWVAHWDVAGCAWIAGLAAVAFLAPNTQQWMRPFMDGFPYRINPISGFRARLGWQPSLGYALATALVTIAAVASLWQPSVFLYFQF